MPKPTVKYQKGFKNRLFETYTSKVLIYPEDRIETKFGSLDENGYITIKDGFMWDGCSGPTIATQGTVRAGLTHDFLYYLLRQGLLNSNWRKQADRELRRVMIEDGCSRLRAWYFYRAVRGFGASAADPQNRVPVLTAP